MTKQYSSFFLCVILCCLAAEFIGPIKLSLGRFTVTFLPLLYAMLLMLVLYLAKPVGEWGKLMFRLLPGCCPWGCVRHGKAGAFQRRFHKGDDFRQSILILQNTETLEPCFCPSHCPDIRHETGSRGHELCAQPRA